MDRRLPCAGNHVVAGSVRSQTAIDLNWDVCEGPLAPVATGLGDGIGDAIVFDLSRLGEELDQEAS